MFKKLISFSVKLVQKYLPEPFVFAIILTLVAFICSVFVTNQSPLETLNNWGNGVWALLGFAMQMSLVLVCGSALADAKIVKSGLRKLASIPKTPIAAIAIVTIISSIACWINWGFGLIVGAVFAKEIARSIKGVDYRLLIASAYSGFVVWHAGLSASIPLAMATEGQALTEVSRGIITSAIPIADTIFATYNIILVMVVIAALTFVNTLMHPKGAEVISIDPKLLQESEDIAASTDPKFSNTCKSSDAPKASTAADKLNNSKLLSLIVSLMGLGYLAIKIVNGGSLDLNGVIMLFLFLGLLLHKTPVAYVKSITTSTQASAGILLQFPFYAGIMGIMTASSAEGISLAGEISNACVAIANEHTFPVLSFLSAGIVNVFVPSGGGQWAVQAPIMIPAGVELGVKPAVVGMAIAWGDAWTNLIQPFWALPALAIAKLDARDIMGFCLINLFTIGLIVAIAFLIL